MFSSGFKESRQKEIIIKEVAPAILSELLKFIYVGMVVIFFSINLNSLFIVGKIELTTENAWGIRAIAERFLFTDLTTECNNFLEYAPLSLSFLHLLFPESKLVQPMFLHSLR